MPRPSKQWNEGVPMPIPNSGPDYLHPNGLLYFYHYHLLALNPRIHPIEAGIQGFIKYAYLLPLKHPFSTTTRSWDTRVY
jgi:hypothetical protein